MSQKPEAYITDWELWGDRLVGRISDHPNQYQFRNETQLTSPLLDYNVEEGWAETENTIYRLGRRAERRYS